MKKTIGLIILLVLMAFGVLFLENDKEKVLLVEGEKTPLAVELSYDMGKIMLHPWYDGETDTWYIFFPSFIQDHVIDCSGLEHKEFYVNGEEIKQKFEWQDNTLYEVVYQENVMQMIFLEDKNLPSLFIETESRANDIIREAKENEEKGNIVSLDHRGKIQHAGSMTISGHGNAWQFYDKRAYDIQLKTKGSLAGMEANSHWKLLHLSNDGDKIHSKLAYDIAEILEAEYVPKTTWTNVYLNGEYYGMYLLATAVRDQDVFKTDSAVLLEKDLSGRYELEEHVISDDGNGFTIHRPKFPDENRKEEIGELVQKVEDSIVSGELDESLIDVDSFITQFLIEEIALNSDGFETSSYVYQVADNSPLRAGPPWDYDACFGEGLHMDKNLTNPAESVLDGEHTELTWYQKLYDNPEFLNKVISKYEAAMTQLKELYEENIDIYAEYIEGSVRNDFVRWKGNFKTLPKTGNYQTWENNLRYLKYFCFNRYNALMERWGIDGEELIWEGNGQEHTIRLLYSGTEEAISLMDGSTLDLSKASEFYQQEGCVAKIEYSEEEFSEFLPVLEDFAIKIELSPKVEETESGKLVVIPKDMFVDDVVYVSVIDIDVEGNTNNLLSAEPMRDIHLEYPKDKSGTIAVYVFADESAATVIDEIMIAY